MRTATINGVDLHYTDQGPQDGPTIIFSNSLGTDLRVWERLIPHLHEDLRVIRYDKRGHGLSEQTEGPYSIAQLADDAAALIRHLELSKVVFVGLSIGGMIGQSLAARHGDLLAGLVISNSAAKIGDKALWQDRISAIRQNGLASIAEPTMERWFSPSFRQRGYDKPWQRMLARQPQEGYISCCEAIAAADLREAAANLDLPVQLIAGDLDGATPPQLVRETADLIKGAASDVIPNAGHIPCVEKPKEHAAIINRFLERISYV